MNRPPATILITGGTGQLGFELQRSLMLHGHILAPTRQQLDLYSADAVESWLNRYRPTLIVNAAAYNAVDLAETERSKAKRLNAGLPEQLAHWCRQRDIPLVHYSSDYVYSGKGDHAWTEDSPGGPVNYYGQSKLEGDLAIQASDIHYLIFRTSWVYSARGHNFMNTMLRLGKAHSHLDVVNDQIGAPTPARLIALVTEKAISQALSSGVYHLAASGHTSWQAFAKAIFSHAAAQGQKLAITPEQVAGIASTDYPTPAPRPMNSRLSLQKLEHALGLQLPHWQQALALTLAELSTA